MDGTDDLGGILDGLLGSGTAASNGEPSTSGVVLIGITLLSVAPALLLMMTAFTKIFVVLSMTRNALGLQTVPPNQVLAGLTLFLSLFIMWPILTEVNTVAVQPYLAGGMTFGQAIDAALEPLSAFMIAHTREEFILDFIHLVPPQGVVTARIVTSPGHLKRIVQALAANLARYEEAHGPVALAEPPGGRGVH